METRLTMSFMENAAALLQQICSMLVFCKYAYIYTSMQMHILLSICICNDNSDYFVYTGDFSFGDVAISA